MGLVAEQANTEQDEQETEVGRAEAQRSLLGESAGNVSARPTVTNRTTPMTAMANPAAGTAQRPRVVRNLRSSARTAVLIGCLLRHS